MWLFTSQGSVPFSHHVVHLGPKPALSLCAARLKLHELSRIGVRRARQTLPAKWRSLAVHDTCRLWRLSSLTEKGSTNLDRLPGSNNHSYQGYKSEHVETMHCFTKLYVT
jgi:hypothetical protein